MLTRVTETLFEYIKDVSKNKVLFSLSDLHLSREEYSKAKSTAMSCIEILEKRVGEVYQAIL